MGYPVAYRRAAPVRHGGGSQPGHARRALPSSSRYAARTPLRPSPLAIPAAAARAASRVGPNAFGLPAQVAASVYQLYQHWLTEQQPFVIGKPKADFKYDGTWQECPTPSSPPCIGLAPTHYVRDHSVSACNSGGPCSINLIAFNIFPLPITPAHVASSNHYYFYTGELSNPNRWTMVRQFWNPIGAPSAGYPQYELSSPEAFPQSGADASPSPDPWSQGINQPRVEAPAFPHWAAPYRNPFGNPYYAPTEQPQRGPLPNTNPRPRDKPDPATAPSVGKPGPRFSINPNANTVQSTQPSSRPQQNPKRARKGVKERKVILSVGGVTSTIVGAITEANDLINAIWDALPQKYRSKGKLGLQDKLKDLYRHWDVVDLPLAVANIIAEQIQDAFYGRASSKLREGISNAAEHGYYRRGVGAQSGDRYRPRYSGDDAYQMPEWREALPSFDWHDVVRAVRRE